ncbi:alpha-galactosidase [Aureobasidium pullulans]|uniref:alpha-galactosidase n=1 Tax=Aureobasidium pullulans TaxID=5580 RepID=A0A4T0BNM7_AURPU|nr:alpha-galactosidase [Aureobasidium pullulans]
MPYITASGTNFSLSGADVSYRFHVDPRSGDLISDHFGGPVDDFTDPATISNSGWSTGLDNVGTPGLTNIRREFPDVGRSDFRLPAIHISHADGDTVSAFTYQSHEIVQGKPALPGLPATFGNDGDVTTLVVTLYDNYSDVSAALSYSIFPEYNAIARSFQITNNGTNNISIERAASFSTDLPNLDLKMLELQGDWSHEANRVIRNVDFGETGFRSTEGYSSHVHNPFFVLHDPTTTETTGEAWGFNLVYTGSFAATAERFSHGFVRVLLGLNPLHASIPVGPGQTFQSPEAVAIYSSTGLGGMSRSFHDLYRNHLSRSNHTFETRPILLNSWEGLGFEINETSLENLANETAGLGIKLFVQDYLINAISNVIKSANISYIKWDNNRAIHEMSSPAADYAYTLGMYRVMDNLTGSYPEILWEGCASGGGRFDPGILHYYPQSWTSDNTDAADRLTIQLGTSLAYPLSSMACHVSAVPNGLTGRNISIEYRAHVALMCGSFGFELNPSELSADERDAIPSIISTWEQINPIVISGSFYRIAWPSDTNWPAVQFVSKDENTAVVFAFQQFAKIKPAAPPLKMQGLDGKARYSSNAFNGTLSGNTLMNGGVNLPWMVRDYQSMLIWLYKE